MYKQQHRSNLVTIVDTIQFSQNKNTYMTLSHKTTKLCVSTMLTTTDSSHQDMRRDVLSHLDPDAHLYKVHGLEVNTFYNTHTRYHTHLFLSCHEQTVSEINGEKILHPAAI